MSTYEDILEKLHSRKVVIGIKPEEFLTSANLDRECQGVKVRVIAETGCLRMFFEIGEHTKSRDMRHIVVPWMMEWRSRLQRIQPPSTEPEHATLRKYAAEIAEGRMTYQSIANAANLQIIKATMKYAGRTEDAETQREILGILQMWGYRKNLAENLLTTALLEIRKRNTPYSTDPITAKRVQTRLKNWRAKQKPKI